MSHVVVVEKNREGKIELSKNELQKMLDDAYDQGFKDGRSRYETITYPTNPYWTYTTYTTTSDSITGTSSTK